jgi:hypothetical protein
VQTVSDGEQHESTRAKRGGDWSCSRVCFATEDNSIEDVVKASSDGRQHPGERGEESMARTMSRWYGPVRKDTLHLKQFPREFARKRSPEIEFRSKYVWREYLRGVFLTFFCSV